MVLRLCSRICFPNTIYYLSFLLLTGNIHYFYYYFFIIDFQSFESAPRKSPSSLYESPLQCSYSPDRISLRSRDYVTRLQSAPRRGPLPECLISPGILHSEPVHICPYPPPPSTPPGTPPGTPPTHSCSPYKTSASLSFK